jgi:hypothetical protein
MSEVHPDELHADAGAELEVTEDAAAITPAEVVALEQLTTPAEDAE